jgi:hypothetical protein
MRHTVAIHDLRTTKLQVGSVDFATEQLIDSLGTGKNNRLALDLDGTLTEADEVGADTYRKLTIYPEDEKDIKTYRLNDT